MILFFSLCVDQSQPPRNRKDIIEFSHVGSDSKYIPPLLLSTNKIDIQLRPDQVAELKDMQLHSMPMTKELYTQSRYDIIITDTLTYNNVLHFIQNNEQYYTNELHENGEGRFIIIVENGRIHNLYHNLVNSFFSDLKKYLTFKSCDSKAAEAVANYR